MNMNATPVRSLSLFVVLFFLFLSANAAPCQTGHNSPSVKVPSAEDYQLIMGSTFDEYLFFNLKAEKGATLELLITNLDNELEYAHVEIEVRPGNNYNQLWIGEMIYGKYVICFLCGKTKIERQFEVRMLRE